MFFVFTCEMKERERQKPRERESKSAPLPPMDTALGVKKYWYNGGKSERKRVSECACECMCVCVCVCVCIVCALYVRVGESKRLKVKDWYRYFFTPNDVSMGGSGALLLSLSLGFCCSLSFISQVQTKNIQNQKYLYYLGLLLSHLLSL